MVGDFNDNGRPDLAVANGTDPGNVSVLLGTGSGAFGAPTNFLAEEQFSRSVKKGTSTTMASSTWSPPTAGPAMCPF